MIEKSAEIPVKMDLLPQLEARITALRKWEESAKKAFISKNNPCSLFEVFSACYICFSSESLIQILPLVYRKSVMIQCNI